MNENKISKGFKIYLSPKCQLKYSDSEQNRTNGLVGQNIKKCFTNKKGKEQEINRIFVPQIGSTWIYTNSLHIWDNETKKENGEVSKWQSLEVKFFDNSTYYFTKYTKDENGKSLKSVVSMDGTQIKKALDSYNTTAEKSKQIYVKPFENEYFSKQEEVSSNKEALDAIAEEFNEDEALDLENIAKSTVSK